MEQLTYRPVDLDVAEQSRLREIQEKSAGLAKLQDQLLTMCQARMSEMQQMGRTFFEEIAKKYGLDLKHVEYAPSPDFTQLVPVAVHLVSNAQR